MPSKTTASKKSTKAKSTVKKQPTRSKAVLSPEASNLSAAAATLFGGIAVIFIGIIQSNDDLKLLFIGFGAALLVLGGVLVGMSTKPTKK